MSNQNFKNNIDELIIDNIQMGEIQKSKVHGYGLFAKNNILKGTILCFLDGQLIDWDVYDFISSKLGDKVKSAKEYFFTEWNAISEDKLLVRALRTKYSFINHSRVPNLEIAHNPLRIIAYTKINCGDELLLDYRKEPLRKEYLDNHGKTYL